jgi:hypothetical protein
MASPTPAAQFHNAMTRAILERRKGSFEDLDIDPADLLATARDASLRLELADLLAEANDPEIRSVIIAYLFDAIQTARQSLRGPKQVMRGRVTFFKGVGVGCFGGGLLGFAAAGVALPVSGMLLILGGVSFLLGQHEENLASNLVERIEADVAALDELRRFLHDVRVGST